MMLHGGRALIDPDAFLAELQVKDRCFVDLCSGGHGHFVMAATRHAGEGGRVIAVDLSRNVLRTLSSHLSHSGYSGVECLWGDVEQVNGIPLSGQSVHVALLANALHWLSAPLFAAREIYRILTPRGSFVLVGTLSESPFHRLAHSKEMSEDAARAFFEALGFRAERRFRAGAHHYAIVFRKEGQYLVS